MPDSVQSIHLAYCENGSDKVYQPEIVANDDGTYDVVASYGRRGSTLAFTSKCAGVDIIKATKAYDKLVHEKVAKGYRPTDNAPPAMLAAVSARDGARADIPIQLLTFVESDELEMLLDAPHICGLEKMDGERRAVIISADGIISGVNRRGLFVALPGDLAEALTLLPHDTILDGEQVGSHYFIFDAQKYAGEDLTGYGFVARHDAVSDDILARTSGSDLIKVVPYSYDCRQLLEDLRAQNAEGIVLRSVTAPYSAGRPASGGPARKYKFYDSATVEFGEQNGSLRSVAMRVYDCGHAIDIGFVTIPVNQAIPAPNDIGEVRYLYANRGGSLYQSAYLGARADMTRADARYDQLKFKREA
jgi:bifunctional non-homologous end joining protein LigD